MIPTTTDIVPLKFIRRGAQRLAVSDAPAHDTTLIQAVSRAFYWQTLIANGAMKNGKDIARAEGIHPTSVNELLRLTLLAPDVIEQILAGRQPRRMTLLWFQHHPLPVDWAAQRDLLQSFE
jgi:predicted urease superfamily metal-dependent hydrolase